MTAPGVAAGCGVPGELVELVVRVAGAGVTMRLPPLAVPPPGVHATRAASDTNAT